MYNPATRSVLILVIIAASLYGAHGCNEGAFLPNEDDCHSYFRCNHGQLVPFQCGPGTAWSQSLLTCNHEYLVPECKKEKVPPKPTYRVDPYDTTKFFKCTYDGCEHQSCPPGSIFSPATNRCEWYHSDRW